MTPRIALVTSHPRHQEGRDVSRAGPAAQIPNLNLMAYLLDANVFIEAKRRHYSFDFCPAFWDWLVEGNAAGKTCSVERVPAMSRPA